MLRNYRGLPICSYPLPGSIPLLHVRFKCRSFMISFASANFRSALRYKWKLDFPDAVWRTCKSKVRLVTYHCTRHLRIRTIFPDLASRSGWSSASFKECARTGGRHRSTTPGEICGYIVTTTVLLYAQPSNDWRNGFMYFLPQAVSLDASS